MFRSNWGWIATIGLALIVAEIASADVAPGFDEGAECGTDREPGTQAVVERSASCFQFGACDNPGYRDQFLPDFSSPLLRVNLLINVICTDNGVCPFSVPEVQEAMGYVQTDFTLIDGGGFGGSGIRFPYRIRFINDSRYTQLTDLSAFIPDDYPMKDDYAIDFETHLNIWVTDLEGSGFRGLSTYPWSPLALHRYGGILIDDDDFLGAGKGTFAHELGHALGLWHVHRGATDAEVDLCGVCWEGPHGGDAAADTVGDFCKDTRATPPNFSCFSPPGNDNCTFGRPWASWDTIEHRNFMGFASLADNCRDHFTPEQAARMRCWLQDAVPSLLPLQQDFCVDAATVEAGVYTGITRTFHGSGVSTCDGGTTFVDTWYRYVADSNGLVTVHTCGTGTDVDTQVGVFSGCQNQPTTEIECSSNANRCGAFNQHGSVTFSATAGSAYYIRVATDSTAHGAYELTICEGGNKRCRPPVARPNGGPGNGGTVQP